jgi:hypothetical protein
MLHIRKKKSCIEETALNKIGYSKATRETERKN